MPAKKKVTTNRQPRKTGKGKSADIIFRRDVDGKDVPSPVYSAADFWLDRFTVYHEIALTALLSSESDAKLDLVFQDGEQAGEWAVTQADIALAKWEARWPNVELPEA